jgi:hypothetical protein
MFLLQGKPILAPFNTCLVATDRGTPNAESVNTKRFNLIFMQCKLWNFNSNMCHFQRRAEKLLNCFVLAGHLQTKSLKGQLYFPFCPLW